MQNGRTFDAETGEPLPFVSIAYSRNGQTRTTASNAEAVYQVQADPGSPVTFAGVGYQTLRMTYRPGVVNVTLQPSTTELPAHEVTAERRKRNAWPWLLALVALLAIGAKRRRRQ